jgi:hypothetical protein
MICISPLSCAAQVRLTTWGAVHPLDRIGTNGSRLYRAFHRVPALTAAEWATPDVVDKRMYYMGTHAVLLQRRTAQQVFAATPCVHTHHLPSWHTSSTNHRGTQQRNTYACAIACTMDCTPVAACHRMRIYICVEAGRYAEARRLRAQVIEHMRWCGASSPDMCAYKEQDHELSPFHAYVLDVPELVRLADGAMADSDAGKADTANNVRA